MLQYSKLLHGRKEWKAKAIARGYKNREQRKTLNRYRNRIAELKAQNKALAEKLSEASEKN